MTGEELDELADEELARIERVAAAATRGPWVSYVVGRDGGADANVIEVGACNELGTFACFELVGGTTADQDFIASARQDIPRLLRQVYMLQARLDSLLAGPPRRTEAVAGTSRSS